MARGRSALSSSSSLSPFSLLWKRYSSLLGLLLLLHLPLGLAVGQTVHTLYWNSTSPIFHSDDPLLVNMEGHKFTFDQVGRTLSFHDFRTVPSLHVLVRTATSKVSLIPMPQCHIKLHLNCNSDQRTHNAHNSFAQQSKKYNNYHDRAYLRSLTSYLLISRLILFALPRGTPEKLTESTASPGTCQSDRDGHCDI